MVMQFYAAKFIFESTSKISFWPVRSCLSAPTLLEMESDTVDINCKIPINDRNYVLQVFLRLEKTRNV